jgi:hypothetical protein
LYSNLSRAFQVKIVNLLPPIKYQMLLGKSAQYFRAVLDVMVKGEIAEI